MGSKGELGLMEEVLGSQEPCTQLVGRDGGEAERKGKPCEQGERGGLLAEGTLRLRV